MSTHDDDFWGDQAEWKPSGNVPRIDADRTRPIDVVRKGWKNLLSSGANATREHGIVRPDTGGIDSSGIDASRVGNRRADVLGDPTPMAPVRADMFDDLDDDLPLDAFSYVNAPEEPIQDLTASYDDFSDSHTAGARRDAATAPIAEDGWDAEFAVAPRRAAIGVDPLLARLGSLAVVTALLVPVLLSATSGSGPDIIETAVTAEAQGSTVQLLPQTSALGDAQATPATDVPTATAPAENASGVSDQTDGASAAADATSPASTDTTATGQASTPPESDASATAELASTESASTEPDATRVDQQATATAAGTAAINDSAEADTPAERVARSCAIDYEVVPGDFWIRIADGAGVPLAELLEANGVSASTPMYAGDSICLPAGSSIPSPPAETTTTTTVATTTAPTTTTAPSTTSTTTTTTTSTVPASSGDVQQIIRDVWPDELEDQALEIAFRESRYVPTAKNFCCYGIFQIYWEVHKSWLDDVGITSAQQLYDPELNARAAYALYERAGGWGPWSL